MAREATIIGTVLDLDGGAWDVREARITKHDFAILLGWPQGHRGPGCGGPRVIPTRELRDYFEANRLSRDGSIYDLPIGRTAVKRIRTILGFDFYCDNAEWWLERLEDLTTMTNTRFAGLHGVSSEMASVMHSRLIGRRIREHNWWREESNAQLLLRHDLPRAYIADRLDISIGAVGRLRWLLKKER